jgi:hypothetical protein
MTARAGDAGAGEETRPADRSPTALARDLLLARKRGEPTDRYASALADLDEDGLEPLRADRDVALAFWVNCYNAGAQALVDRHPGRYESPLRIVRFFRTPALTVGGADLSLDRIENGILRGGRSKYGLGYLPKLRATGFERRHRLADPDPRIHFALNCCAESCPAIRAYEPESIDDQLDFATRTYLDSTVKYDPDAGTARIPRLFLWFRGDFGGGGGIRQFLRDHGAIPADATPRLRYRSWDWSKTAGKFADGEARD